MRRWTSSAYRAIALAVVMTLSSGTIALAAPSTTPSSSPSAITVPVDPGTQAFRSELERRQTQLDAFRAQLDELDQQLNIAAEAYDAASEDLKSLQEKLDVAHQDLGASNDALTVQQDLLDTRVDAIYRDGELSPAEILLGAKSIPDFLQRLQFIQTISSADADLAKQLRVQRDQIANEEVDLATAEIEARALEFALKARKVEIELRIAERQAMMTSAQKDLLALLDSEAARRSADELALWREIMSGASKAGVTIDPQSPAETILAYHGIPYVWAGASPTGFDCSGLTMYVMRQHGIELPHHAASQYLLGTKVAVGDLRSGDLVFFGSPVYHVGMYIGGGYFVQAPRTGDFVKVSKLSERDDFVGARRYPWRNRVGKPMGVADVSLPAGLQTQTSR